MHNKDGLPPNLADPQYWLEYKTKEEPFRTSFY